jgi:CRP-like cAMP-binding protein
MLRKNGVDKMYQQWVDVLYKTDLFTNINKEELLGMLYCLSPKIKKYEKNEIVSIEGHDINGIGVILSGVLTISKDNFDGSRIIINKMEPGNMFGEIAAFSERRLWPATVEAQTECHVMFMAPEKIVGSCQNACLSHRLLIMNMLKIVSNKAMNLNKKIEYLSIKSIREKICKYLMEQYRKQKSTTLHLNMNRNEMSDFLNVTRPSLSREMSFMKDEGMIDYYRSSIKILDLDKIGNCVS